MATLGCHGDTPRALPASGRYLYVTDSPRGGVFGFRLNEQTGRLVPIQSGVFLPGYLGASELTFAPNGSFGFLRTLVEVVPFAVAADGGLYLRPERIDASRGVAIHPSGKFLFSVGAASILFSYRLGEDGVLSEPLRLDRIGMQLVDPMVDAEGRRLYVKGDAPLRFLVFDIDGLTGALTETTGSPKNYSQPGRQRTARIYPDGRFLFLLNDGYEASMSVFRRTADGYEPVAGSPFVVARYAKTFTLDPTGRFIFVVHPETRKVSTYALDDVGALHPVAGSPIQVAAGPEGVAVDPDGRFLYIAYPGANTVSVLAIDAATGKLTPVSDSTIAVADQPRDLFLLAVPQPHVALAPLPFMDPAQLPVQTTVPDEAPAR